MAATAPVASRERAVGGLFPTLILRLQGRIDYCGHAFEWCILGRPCFGDGLLFASSLPCNSQRFRRSDAGDYSTEGGAPSLRTGQTAIARTRCDSALSPIDRNANIIPLNHHSTRVLWNSRVAGCFTSCKCFFSISQCALLRSNA